MERIQYKGYFINNLSSLGYYAFVKKGDGLFKWKYLLRDGTIDTSTQHGTAISAYHRTVDEVKKLIDKYTIPVIQLGGE
jgi:hypothetical protein